MRKVCKIFKSRVGKSINKIERYTKGSRLSDKKETAALFL